MKDHNFVANFIIIDWKYEECTCVCIIEDLMLD